MTAIQRRNQPAHETEWPAIFFAFVEDLIAQGWRVLGSGDGLSFENDGQTAGSSGSGSGGGYHLFTSSSGVVVTSNWSAGNWGNINSSQGACWIRVASPADAEHYIEYLFQMSSSSYHHNFLAIDYCRDQQRFDSGASAWVRPSVSSGIALSLVRSLYGWVADPSTLAQHYHPCLAPSGTGHSHWYIGDASEDYDFLLWVSRDDASTLGEVFSAFGRLRTTLGLSRSDGSPDPDPYIHFVDFVNGGGNSTHNFKSDGVIFRTEYTVALGPERLEDRDGSGGLESGGLMASYGLGDPGVPPSVQRHYAVGIMIPTPAVNNDDPGTEHIGLDRATGDFIVDLSVKVARTNEDDDVSFTFHKGYIKNRVIGLVYPSRAAPVVTRNGTDDYRVAWGALSLPWGAAERVELHG